MTFTPVSDARDQTDMCAGQNLCWTSLTGDNGGRKGTMTVVRYMNGTDETVTDSWDNNARQVAANGQ